MSTVTQEQVSQEEAPVEQSLPRLREDIVLQPFGVQEDMPTWTIYDPSSHKYFRINWLDFEILARWSLEKASLIAQSISEQTTLKPTTEDVLDFVSFAERNCLLISYNAYHTSQLVARKAAREHSIPAWLLHNYLFLRLRVINPNRFLESCLPLINWMFNRYFLIGLTLFSLLGFYLVHQRWESFLHSFANTLNPEGAVAVAFAISLSKVVHELGHGFAAKKLGCRVPSMGVAFLVMCPVLWTDVTDAWRLTRKRDRLLIDAAGMISEIILAASATLLWSILDDGPLRSAVFILASSTWILTLTVNLSPLMRFDGYFILSDMLGIENLQDRAFAITRWWMRKMFLGANLPLPEKVSQKRLHTMLVYSLATWIYRFGLFLGIALLVYHMAFKALGFFLMGIEIWFFLAGPIVRETWTMSRIAFKTGWNWRLMATISAIICALLIFVVPWQSHIRTAGILRAAHQFMLFPSEIGVIEKIPREGEKVVQDNPVFSIHSDTITHEKEVAESRLQGIIDDIKGQVFDQVRRESINAAREEMQRITAQHSQATQAQEKLTAYAPFTGQVVDIPRNLQVGSAVNKKTLLGYLIDNSNSVVTSYLPETELYRVEPGSKAYFFSSDGREKINLTVASISPVASKSIDDEELVSNNAGPIAVRKPTSKESGKNTPDQSMYKITLVPDEKKPVLYRQVGTVVIKAEKESLLAHAWNRSLAILIRELQL